MTTQNAKETIFSIGEDVFPLYFGEWIKRRRQELDLTQERLAKLACCSVHAIRKIEIGERRPSRQLAELLSKSLEIPSENQATFILIARGERGVESLRSLTPGPVSLPAGQPVPIPGNLPRALTPLIGRVPEITALGQLLHDPRCSLLTITGPGGIGKTRLAVEAAHQSKDLYPDGVWFVSLAPLNLPTLIIPTIAEALNFKFQASTDPQAQLVRYLRTKKALLVLDNAEHLLDGVEVLTEILEGCPQVNLLVTSRERLNLLSEWVFEIQGLPLPPGDQVEQFESYSSVALFLQSAQRVRAGFEIREAERKWVLRICRAMEGMPLGIELSAAWVGLLSCEEIANEIEHNLDFLSVSMRDLPERHRSLRATLDHSWRLLNDKERSILCRLSVFRGSFSLEAAQEICGASLVLLSSLRNKCLLYRTEQELFHLHEIIRQYAGFKLAEHPDENEQVKDQHALYYVQCLADWEKALQSSRQLETLNEMAQEIENLAQGWRQMVKTCQAWTGKRSKFGAVLIHHSLFSLSIFYEERCRSWEAIALFKEAVETLKTLKVEFEDSIDRTCFFSVLGHIVAHLGWHLIFVQKGEEAREYLEGALQLLEDSQSRIEKAHAQLMMAEIDYIQGQVQKSSVLLEQSRKVFREEGEDWWYLFATIQLASAFVTTGKHSESKELFLEGFRLLQHGDLRQELRLRYGYASLLFVMNDFAKAERLMHENLQLSYQLGNDRLTAFTLFDLGKLALATQRIVQAEEHLQKSIDLLSELGESHELALVYLYLGKCFAAQTDLHAARHQFRQVIKIGQALDMSYLVYWGLVNVARTYLEEGQTGKALEISLTLRCVPVELKRAQDDGDRLLADLKARLPKEHVEAIMKQVDGKISADQGGSAALAYALECFSG